MSGVERIEQVFRNLNQTGSAAFMPYHAMGYPNRQQSLKVIAALAEAGADLVEIGIPHSDPLADGPTIQTATYAALVGGTTVADCLQMVRELRAQGVNTPFCAMSYYNPILAFGEENFVDAAAKAGVDGLIVPDLPPESRNCWSLLAVRPAWLQSICWRRPALKNASSQWRGMRPDSSISSV